MPGHNPARLPVEIGENDLFTGREVRILLVRERAHAELHLWIKLEEAAGLLGRRQGTLRRQAERWSRMDAPPVHVRKQGPGRRSHWLLDEAEVYTLVRRRVQTESAAGPNTRGESEGEGDDDEQATYQKWDAIVTKHLSC